MTISDDRGTRPSRVAVLGDRPMTTQLLAAALERDQRFTLAATAQSAERLAPTNGSGPLDVIVLLVGGPGWGLLAELVAATSRHPTARVVVVAAHVDVEVVQETASLGAVVMSTGSDLDDLMGCVAGADPASALVDDRHRLADHGITTREGEILHMLADGVTPQQISRRLGIATYTTRDHLSALRRKLGCTSAVELVIRAHRLGLAPHVGRPLP